MPYAPHAQALRQYRETGTATAAAGVHPMQLIEMLYGGAIDHLAAARGSLQRGELAPRLRHIQETLAILEHLRLTLDFQRGGEIAQNLAGLYDYMRQRLALANASADARPLEEVMDLLKTLHAGWQQLPQSAVRH